MTPAASSIFCLFIGSAAFAIAARAVRLARSAERSGFYEYASTFWSDAAILGVFGIVAGVVAWAVWTR